ncbi:MAG: PAS domain S-box protein, partial [Deltaproteobacteria bacterium]|nr:PAS domain S-box protein [Deltaproteobacteria bacterium]
TDKIAKLLGRHPVGMTFDAKDETLSDLSDGKLHLNKEGLYGIFLKTVPKAVCNSIEKLLNIKKIYGIGFTKDNELFGTIVIFLKENAGELKNKQITEAFLKQASIAVQKRQAEEELRLFSQAAESSPDGVAMGNFEGRITYVNETFVRMFGYSKEELMGKEIASIHPKDQIPKLEEALKATIEGGWTGELVGKRKNGELFPMAISSTVAMDEKGRIIAHMASHRDITERKQSEEVLRESEEKYRSLIESTEDSIYLLDKNCKYLFMNKKHLSRFGLTLDKVVGRAYSEFHSEDDTKELVGKVEKVFETGKSLWYEYRSQKDGGYFLRTLSPVKEPDGSMKAVTVVSKDITQRKQAEEALRRSNEELLKEHNQRMMLSKSLIDLLEKDRRQIAMELHDHIGQILTSLKMNLEMIHGKLKPEHGELGTRLTAAQERTIQAIKDVRNISRGLRPGMLDALGLVPSLRDLFNETQQQIDIEIQLFSRNIPKRFNPEKELAIYRIAQEGLTNIIKHAQAKRVFVNLVKKSGVVSLSIEDNGVGFDQAKAMKISKKKGPLGLLIMRERAVQLDGEFTIESQPGKGTHLLVEIPL